MTEPYRGKRVLVTGCASGIGAALARALAGHGAEVIGLDLRESDAPLTRFVGVDLGDPASIDRGVEEVGGVVDVLFNCAGLSPTLPLLPVVRVNFLGLRHLSERIAADMPAGGAIVSVSSNGGLDWRARRAALDDFLDTDGFDAGLGWVEAHVAEIANGYRFAKEALTLWTLRESARLIGRGIRINCTSPGAVQTPMLAAIEEKVPAAAIDVTAAQIGRRSSPEEQVGPLLFLGSDAASYVNGVDLAVDGGFAAAVALR